MLISSSSRRSALLLMVLLAWLWLRLFNHLRIEWTVNEQYAYGWAVPFLCLFLAWRRWRDVPPSSDAPRWGETLSSLPQFKVQSSKFEVQSSDSPLLTPPPVAPPRPGSTGDSPVPSDAPPGGPRSNFSLSLLVAFLFTRWIEEANPDWRLISWALALEVVAFTLVAIYAAGGPARLWQLAFPILFFLVAVPWPTPVEQPVIQALTRGIVAATAEFLNAFGVAAVPHGNVIETTGGLVDIDEACSGIRSLQAVLMLALFFGELLRFTARRRGALCLVAFALAGLFNLIRTLTLSFVASQRGPAAVESWHDPAGVAILVGCFIGVWAVAAWMGRKTRNPEPETRNRALRLVPTSPSLPVALAALLLAGELAVHFWYARPAPAPTVDWTAQFPTNNATFKAAEIPRSAEKILRFNKGRSGTWQNEDGTRWQMIYLRWQPGRSAAALARNHTPEICLPAAGRSLRGVADVPAIEAGGLRLPFRSFTTGPEGRPLFVFYTLWEDGARTQHAAAQELTWRVRLDAVRARRRNPGQRVLELAIWGARDEAHAVELLRAGLGKLISAKTEN